MQVSVIEPPWTAVVIPQATLSTPLAGEKLHIEWSLVLNVCTITLDQCRLNGCLVSSQLISRLTKWPDQEKNQPDGECPVSRTSEGVVRPRMRPVWKGFSGS